ncbi:MAG TPA: hypothetical protein VK250_00520 [Nitrososphaeraceae archaeon]|nr:hypothetical protein [Nitrososphaeraceae archaeon]
MPDWDNIVKSKKNVLSKDNFPIGNVIANYANHILVIDDVNNHTYKIPKSSVQNYNGSELFLSINRQDLKKLNEHFFRKSDEPKSINDMLIDILIKGLSYINGNIKIAIKNNDSLRIETADKKIKLNIIDPSIFDAPLEILKENKIDFFEYMKEAKEFGHILSKNELTLYILNKGENTITLGKNASPSFSKLITRSDDIQIDSIRKSIKLASDINKDEEK